MTQQPLVVCPGCGALLQDQQEELPGYLPEHLRLREGVVCRRCFRMRHYGQGRKAPFSDIQVTNALRLSGASCSGILAVLNAGDLSTSASVLPWARSLQKPLVVVINKADLVRRWISASGLQAWGRRYLDIGDAPIRVLSAFRKDETDALGAELPNLFDPQNNMPEGNRYLALGLPNVGKSTLLAAWTGDQRITRSALPGTTVGELAVAAPTGDVFVDFPGLRLKSPWLPLLCPACLKAHVPAKRLTRRTFLLKEGSSLMWGGAVWLRFLQGKGRPWIRIVVFAPDLVSLHLTKAGREGDLLDRHAGSLWPSPCASCWETLRPRMDLTPPPTWMLQRDHDLAFPELGWCTTTQGEGLFEVLAPEGVEPSVRPALIGMRTLRRPHTRCPFSRIGTTRSRRSRL